MFHEEPKYSFWGKVACVSSLMLAVLGGCYNGEQPTASAAQQVGKTYSPEYYTIALYGGSGALTHIEDSLYFTLDKCIAAGSFIYYQGYSKTAVGETAFFCVPTRATEQ